MDSTWPASLHAAPQPGFWLMIRNGDVSDAAAGTAKILLRTIEKSKNAASARLPNFVRSVIFQARARDQWCAVPPQPLNRPDIFATIPAAIAGVIQCGFAGGGRYATVAVRIIPCARPHVQSPC